MREQQVEEISIPKTVFATAETLEDLEDWFLSKDPEFISKLNKIRREEDLKGKGVSLETLCKKWNIKL